MLTRPLGTAIFALALILATPLGATAQPPGPGGGPGWGMGPGRMMGPGMMGRSDFRRYCHPGMMGLSAWRIDDIERRLKLDANQLKALDALKAASAKAEDAARAACPSEVPASATDRLAAMERRMEAMLASIKVLRPAFDDFYKSLNDDQKSNFERAGPRRWRGPW